MASLQVLLMLAGNLHWLLWVQATQNPWLLQNPAAPPCRIQPVLMPARLTLQVLVVVLHQALLQLLSEPGGRLQWLLCRQPTHAPLLQTPALPAKLQALLLFAGLTVHLPVATLHAALLQAMSSTGATLHWLSIQHPGTHVPVPQVPGTFDPATTAVQLVLFPSAWTTHLLVLLLQTARLQDLSVPAGSVQWLSVVHWMLLTHVPLPLPSPYADTGSYPAGSGCTRRDDAPASGGLAAGP